MANERLAIDGGEPLRREPFASRWDFGEPEKRNLRETIDRASEPGGSWGTTNQVREFEDAFAKRHGVKYAIATDSGTGAIHAAVGAVNPEPGDEIITTPTSDIGTVLGIMLQNAVPVFADWDPDTFNTDPVDLERRITDRTRAIIVVHLFGNPCDMDAIMDIARRHNLVVIEDLSQAHLAEYQGRMVGTIGDIGCLSIGGKTLTAGGGGHDHHGRRGDRAPGPRLRLQGLRVRRGVAQLAPPHFGRPRLLDRVLIPGRLPSHEPLDGRHRKGAAGAPGRLH